MTALVFKLVGGIGLFLMGMVLLTDGLKSFAGDSLRRALLRFTGRPSKAFAAGAVATSLVQSSSATTVAVIGFVSAGLLTFPQAVGVVIGASLGTTSTGWIVSVLGLKVSVGFYALPLVGIGAFLRLLATGRRRSFGTALAGFGLIFIGIETLQDAMGGLSGLFNLSQLPAAGVARHGITMLIGAAMTVIMQSSSAAVATTLTALHTGSINFEQAAALVIGAAIGTTVTGALAAIGANTATKRTALAHVLFNVATGIIAVALMPLLLWGIRLAQHYLGLDPGAMSLAAFHTTFIALGAALFLPFVDRFSGWIERLLPEKGPTLTRNLDPTLCSVPAVALEATRRALRETACATFEILSGRLPDAYTAQDSASGDEIRQALFETRQFIARIPPVVEDQPVSLARVWQMHAIDHLARLHAALDPPEDLRRHPTNETVRAECALCREALEQARIGLCGREPAGWLETLENKSLAVAELHRQGRPRLLKQTADGILEPENTLNTLDALRWLNRVAYHTWRICMYLGGNAVSSQPEVIEMNAEDLNP